MRKYLALIALTTLAACGGGGGSDNSASTQKPNTTPNAGPTSTGATTTAGTGATGTTTSTTTTTSSGTSNGGTETPTSPPAAPLIPASVPVLTQPASTGLALSYQTEVTTGGGETYAAPTPNSSSSDGYQTANQSQRSIVIGNFGGNNCPAILEAASYDVNLPQFSPVVWTSDCAGHFALDTSSVFTGTAPLTGFVTASFAGDFNKTGRDSVLLIDSGNEIPDANGDFPGAPSNHLLLNEGGKLVDRTSTNLPSEGTNYNHVSTMYHLGVLGGRTLVLNRFNGHQFAGGGIEFQINDGTGKFVGHLEQLPPELAYTAYSSFNGSIDYVQPGTALLTDLDSSGTPYLITGTYAIGTYLTKQYAVFIYKLIAGKYQRIATVPIPDAYKDIPYSASQPTDHLGVSSIVSGDFDGSGHPDLAVLWEGQGITRLQLIRNNGNDSFTDASVGIPSLDIINSQSKAVAGVTELQSGDIDGDGKDELLLKTYDAAAQQSMNRTGWRPAMHMVNGLMQFFDIYSGADQVTQLTQLNASVDQSIEYLFGNLGTGKNDLLVSVWNPGSTINGFTVTNDRTFRVFLHK